MDAKNEERPAKKLKLDRPINQYLKEDATSVKIIVGPEKKVWILNKQLACDRVELFRAMFTGGIKEELEQELHLPEDDAEAFGHVVEWVYGQEILCNVSHDFDKEASEETSKHILGWCRVYVVADKLGMEDLRDQAARIFAKCLFDGEWFPEAKEINYIYRNGSSSSKLRKVVVDCYVGSFFSRYSDDVEIWSVGSRSQPDFSLALTVAMKEHLEIPIGFNEGCQVENCRLHGKASEE